MNGHPLPIVTQNERELFELDEEALASVLLRPEVQNKHVCVLAIAGAFRKGKTFLLNFLLRYCANRGDDNWLGDPSSALQGFRWRQGYTRETTGILIWSEPFLVTRDDGDEVAVILMDSQGTFDKQSSLKDSTVVFALSLLASSVMVYNLMHNIQEDNLMNLQTFINYGTLATDGSNDSSVYQKLWFLVRDWGSAAQLPYGKETGQQLLDEVFQVTPQTRNQELRTNVRRCFEDIACYLMPHPGRQSHENAEFSGKLDELEEQFIDHLKQLVPLLLAPNNLVVKKLGGNAITARDLFTNFRSYVAVFASENLPAPMTVAESMANVYSQVALRAALELYTTDMRTFLTVNEAAELDQLEAEHDRVKNEAVNLYQQRNNLGRRIGQIFQQFEQELENGITALYNAEFKTLVSSRCALRAAKQQYVHTMAAVVPDGRPAPHVEALRSAHREGQDQAIQCYRQMNEFGRANEAIFNDFLEQLRTEINTHFEVELLPRSNSRAVLQACKKHYLLVMDAVLQAEHENEVLEHLRVCHRNELQVAVRDYIAQNEPASRNPGIFDESLGLLRQEIAKAFTDEYLPIAALLDSWNLYIQAMEGAVEGETVLDDEYLSNAHDREQRTAIEHYLAETEPSQNNQNVNEYHQLLEQALEQLFETNKEINTAKRSVKKSKVVKKTFGIGMTMVQALNQFLFFHNPIQKTVNNVFYGLVGGVKAPGALDGTIVTNAIKKYDKIKDTERKKWFSSWRRNRHIGASV